MEYKLNNKLYLSKMQLVFHNNLADKMKVFKECGLAVPGVPVLSELKKFFGICSKK